MLGVHSLAPTRLYTGTETKKAAPKPPPPDMTETQPAVVADSHGAGLPLSTEVESRPVTALTQQHTAPSHESRDSGVADLEATNEPDGPEGKAATTTSTATRGRQVEAGQQSKTDSIDFSSRQAEAQAEAGPSRPAAARPTTSRHSSLQREPADALARPNDLPDETHHNAIAYRRDPETVIAYLVALPPPVVQGVPLDVPTRYFMYAPPAPHLAKPANHGHGSSEGYVRRLNRRWQQSVHDARLNAHNGKRFSARGTRSKLVRGVTRALDRLKDDDVTFLSRVHPSTVTHLILMHPRALAGGGAPQEVLQTFRRQVFEGKRKAKRDSIVSAALFFPALAIDTAAIFFGGLAEVDGIWMLVSVKAYRTARVITRKIGPDPKTMEIEQRQLIEDAKRSGFPAPPEPEEEDEGDAEPGAIRRSVDALRRSMGSVTYRMNPRNKSRSKRNKGGGGGGDASDEAAGRPQTTGGDDPDGGFTGGELEHYEEEEEGSGDRQGATATRDASPQSGSEPELSGWLEHSAEEAGPSSDGAPGPSNAQPERREAAAGGGVLEDGANERRPSVESDGRDHTPKKGSKFQLTFYPSPAMDVLSRYVQNSCHNYNGRAYPSPEAEATEQDVLDMIGWHPEQREHDTAEQITEDVQWQRRDIEDDLKFMALKAAKAWDKTCRKEAKKAGRKITGEKPGKRALAGRFHVRRPVVQKGKARETPIFPEAGAAEAATTTATEQAPSRGASLRARMGAVRDKARRRQPAEEEGAAQTTEKKTKRGGSRAGKGAAAAALLCVPCISVARRVKQRRTRDETSGSADEGDQQVRIEEGQDAASAAAAAPGRRTMRQRFSERNNAAAARGPSTDTTTTTTNSGGALWSRFGSRRARQHEDGVVVDEGPSLGMMERSGGVGEGSGAEGQAIGGGADGGEADTLQPNNNKKNKSNKVAARLVAIPAGLAAAIGAAINKSRRSRENNNKATPATSEEDESATTGAGNIAPEARNKTGRFSALRARIRALRTKVTKKRTSSSSSSSPSGTRDYFRELKEKRRRSSNKKKKQQDDADDAASAAAPKNVKEHGAIAGVVAACLALPAGKVRELREKRREGQGQQAETASSSAPLASTEMSEASSSTRPGTATLAPPNSRSVVQQPIPEEGEDGGLERPSPPGTTQYLPGHGQSEIPVVVAGMGAGQEARILVPAQPEPPARPGAAETAPAAVEAATPDTAAAAAQSEPSAERPPVQASPAAGVSFRSIRDSIGGLKPRKTAAPAAAEPADGQTATADFLPGDVPTDDEPAAAANPGRLQSFRDGFGNLRPKRRAEAAEAPAEPQEGPVVGSVGAGENTTTEDTPFADDEAAAPRERRFQSIKDGFGNMMPKKTGTDEPAKPKVYKDSHKSGFMDRMRWIWYVA